MRAYSAASEEAVRARDLLKDWAGGGFLTQAQYHSMEQETVCELRRTNIFLRLPLFLFPLLLLCAAMTYGAAEFAVSRFRLFRYGIEEALAACSVGFLCAGMQAALSSGTDF